MRPLNTLATTLLAAFLVVSLGACGKKKTSSSGGTAAATPGSACTNYNPLTGQWTNSAGQICTPTGGNATQVCPAAPNNFVMVGGMQQWCTPGQTVATGYNYPGQYPYTPYPNSQTSGCDQYYYYYGIQYVPVILSGQLQCVRIDVLNQYAQGTPYYNNYDYYYAYPPYSYGGSGYCGTQVGVSFGGFSGSICF